MLASVGDITRNMNRAVDALYKLSPKRLEELAARDEGLYKELLTPNQGATLGAGEEKLAAEVWAEALEAAIAKVDQKLQASIRSLRIAARIELAASIGAAIAGSTLIALVTGDASKVQQIVVAVVGLLCSIAAIVVAGLRRTYVNGDKIEHFGKAKKATAEAAVLTLHLRSLARGTAPDQVLIGRADALLQELLTLDL